MLREQGLIDLERWKSDEIGELRPAVDAACFRLAQESVTNALRHARAEQLLSWNTAPRVTGEVVVLFSTTS